MKNHMYQFEGKTRIQKSGGSIGLALTGIVARIRMNLWVRKFKKLCEVNRIDPLMLKIYVDDKNTLWKQLRKGWKWNGNRMEWKKE